MLAAQDSQPSLQDVVRISKRFSSSERLYLAKTLLDSLVTEELPKMDGPETDNSVITNEQGDFSYEAILSEREAFIQLHPTLLQRYPNEHVAIYQGRLIDHDKDGLALSLRIYKQHPDEFVWIAPLKEQPLEEWIVRSPRFEAFSE